MNAQLVLIDDVNTRHNAAWQSSYYLPHIMSARIDDRINRLRSLCLTTLKKSQDDQHTANDVEAMDISSVFFNGVSSSTQLVQKL